MRCFETVEEIKKAVLLFCQLVQFFSEEFLGRGVEEAGAALRKCTCTCLVCRPYSLKLTTLKLET